jgi:hypothetical protein
MPSRADLARGVAMLLHALGVACAAAAAWRLAQPATVTPPIATVADDSVRVGTGLAAARAPLAALVAAAPGETLAVHLATVPGARVRGALRALADAGHALALTTPAPLAAPAIAARVTTGPAPSATVVVAGDSGATHVVGDAAGTLDSVRGATVLRLASVAGVARVRAGSVRATAPVLATTHGTRVLVAGAAGWESRFVVTALEEAGWGVDAALAVAPTVVVRQGEPVLANTRHVAAIVLPGAPPSVLRAVPAFVRAGGGAVLVGDAAREGAAVAVRAGVPGVVRPGEAGMEASDDEPRHGLDLVPIASLVRGGVALESRDGATAVAARRVGAGRVLQVGYADSWRWRMAGAESAPVAHRRWWSALVASVVSPPMPAAPRASPLHDTLDAAPIAALAASLPLPRVAPPPAPVVRAAAWLPDARALAVAALVAFTLAWALRRRGGLA